MSANDSVSDFDSALRRELRRAVAAAMIAVYDSYALTEATREAIAHAYLATREIVNARDTDGASIETIAKLLDAARKYGDATDQSEILRAFAMAVNDAREAAIDAVPVACADTARRIDDAIARRDWFSVAKAICTPKAVS